MTTALRAKQVLVVEDNLADIDLLRELFGHETNVLWHFVGNIVQARNFLARRPPYQKASRPDLVLLDLRLPIFHGSVLIPEIRGNLALSQVRIVVITGSAKDGDLYQALRLGADEAHFKPSSYEGWQALIQNILT